MINAKILADSLAPSGRRLTTWELTYPRFIHSELMTHRKFARNAASSRAIPIKKTLEMVSDNPAMPVWWGKNQSGMQAREELDPGTRETVESLWLDARDAAVRYAQKMHDLGLHKQITNRVLEPWMHMTVIVSATEYENFFGLRCHPDAQPEFRALALQMRDLYRSNEPLLLQEGEWHLPFISIEDRNHSPSFTADQLCRISIGRCARVSFLTHEGVRSPFEDINLTGKLIQNGHMSPTEHVAMALSKDEQHGCFNGWKQYRKFLPGEDVFRAD